MWGTDVLVQKAVTLAVESECDSFSHRRESQSSQILHLRLHAFMEAAYHGMNYYSNSKHWFTIFFLQGRCRKEILGV